MTVIGRFFGTAKYEHLFRGPIDDGDALAVEVGRFRQIYNTIRPHQALADRTPRDAYRAGFLARCWLGEGWRP